MGDCADDAKAASYTAQDLMIVERDIGRLAKFTFDMGGTGDLLSLALSVPPWEDLHRLSRDELRLTNLVTTDAVADVFPQDNPSVPVAEAKPSKPVQDRFVHSAVDGQPSPTTSSTKTAEASAPTGAAATAPAEPSK
jgi:predicted component of type VI protein secretion system